MILGHNTKVMPRVMSAMRGVVLTRVLLLLLLLLLLLPLRALVTDGRVDNTKPLIIVSVATPESQKWLNNQWDCAPGLLLQLNPFRGLKP